MAHNSKIDPGRVHPRVLFKKWRIDPWPKSGSRFELAGTRQMDVKWVQVVPRYLLIRIEKCRCNGDQDFHHGDDLIHLFWTRHFDNFIIPNFTKISFTTIIKHNKNIMSANQRTWYQNIKKEKKVFFDEWRKYAFIKPCCSYRKM